MELLRRLFRNPDKAIVGIAIFLAVLLALFSCESRGAESELRFSAGSTVARGIAPVIGFDILWPHAGPVNTDYEFGMKLVGQSTYDGVEQANNIMTHLALVDGWRNFGAGFGIAYVSNVDRYNGGHQNFWLMLKWDPSKRVRVQYEHVSCAGSCSPNLGRDMVTVGWRF